MGFYSRRNTGEDRLSNGNEPVEYIQIKNKTHTKKRRKKNRKI